jgi:hypothetical protein
MLTEQMKDDLRKVTWKWKEPAIPFFTRLLGRTMETHLHYPAASQSSVWLFAPSLDEGDSVVRRKKRFSTGIAFGEC